MASHELVLLRHGESTWNRENRFTGWTDVDLSPRGVEEARAAARLLVEGGYTFRRGVHLAPQARAAHAVVSAICALLEDYFARDLWWVLERPRTPRVHLVVAGRSPLFGEADRRRAEACALVHAMATGHWVHQEDPEGMLRLLLEAIPR